MATPKKTKDTDEDKSMPPLVPDVPSNRQAIALKMFRDHPFLVSLALLDSIAEPAKDAEDAERRIIEITRLAAIFAWSSE